MESYRKSLSVNSQSVVFYEIPIHGDDIYAKHVWSTTSKQLSAFVSQAPSMAGYELFATVNGGAFLNVSPRQPYGSLQHYNSAGNWVEVASSQLDYGDGPCDFMIENGKVKSAWIAGMLGENDAKPELLRSGYIFDISNGTLNISAGCADSGVVTGTSKRIGFAFAGEETYLIVTETSITTETLRQLCVNRGYGLFVNLDGGGSTGLYKGTQAVISTTRGLNEAIHFYKRVESVEPEEPETPTEHQTMRLTMTVPTISPNRYPTRPSVNGTYNPNTYFINTGDVVVISDIKAASDGNVVCQIADCLTDGVSSSVLNGRWFVYDKNNFS